MSHLMHSHTDALSQANSVHAWSFYLIPVQNSRGQVSKYLQGVIQKNFCWFASSSGKVPFVSPLVEGSPAKSASVIALMLSRSLKSVSTAQAGKVVHMFVVYVLYFRVPPLVGAGSPLKPTYDRIFRSFLVTAKCNT